MSEILRIAFLHLAPVPGDLEHNRRLVETGLAAAGDLGAQWVLTPELCTCGYEFVERLGDEWIQPQPDAWTQKVQRLLAQRGMTCFLAQPERDPQTNQCYNAVFAFGADGILVGKHRKISVIPGAESAWATPGTEEVAPVATTPLKAGLLICADAYPPTHADRLQTQGAQILLSPAAWCPGDYGSQWRVGTAHAGYGFAAVGVQPHRRGSTARFQGG
jgi:predicted amidohydrolase